MRLRNLLSFTVFGVIIAVSIVYIASFGIRTSPPANRTNLSMAVPDVKGIAVGSNVLLRGVAVGKVTKVTSAVNDATIDFYVDGNHPIPVDSDVRLENLSALGEAYVGLVPRTADGPVLKDGQHIATEAVTLPPSISQLATSVVRVLNQLDPDQLVRIVDEAHAALPDPHQVLPNLVHASTLLRNQTSGMQGRGQKVLDNFQTLLRNADWVGPVLASQVKPVWEAGDGIAGVFQGMMLVIGWNNPRDMELFGNFLGRIQAFLDSRGPDLKVITEALVPKVDAIAGSLMNLDTAQILSNILKGIPEDGAITLHVTVPDR